MAHLLRKYVIAPTGVQENSFVCANPKDRANNVTAGCKHTPLRSVASLLRKHCPRPTVLPFIRCTPVTTYFPPTSLSKLRWQPIFIPAQGSSYTIKTVGGEAVRRFFSLKYAVLLYTISTLFTDPPLRKQKSFRKVFAKRARTLFLRRSEAECIFLKKRNRVPAPPRPRIPCGLRERLRR